MSTEIEMDNLSKSRTVTHPVAPDEPQGGRLNRDADQTQAVTLWAYTATLLLLVLAVPMIFSPSILLYTTETGTERRNALTPLESFLCLHTGILLATFALALLFNIPSSPEVPQRSAGGHPLLVALTSACGLIAFLSYNTTSVGSLAALVFLGSAVIAVWGMWTILFSGSSYISRKTGADKRTSRFLFGNKSAASAQKKEWKK